jgi:predicted MFS family arabinose efflux permease
MLKKVLQSYFNNFKGFPKEIWILATITFINRAGVMVVPFLSKYLHEKLHYSLSDVGTIMMFFGCGSFVGSWLGGKMADKIGFHKVMVFSLFTTGLSFFVIQYITTFWGLCFGLFLLMTIADMYRPAMFVSIKTYTTPETQVKALTLVRLAINLGFSAGPALGGLIIMGMGYQGLFWVDGGTCILAILIFAYFVKEKSFLPANNQLITKYVSPLYDKPFRLFMIISFVMGLLFFQLFTTLPLYYKKMYNLTEFQTGLLITLNGLIIFACEMGMVSYFEKYKTPTTKIILGASFLMAISFLLLLIEGWVGILIIFMIIMTVGEMMGFPFTNKFAMNRASKGNEGRFLAFYAMSFSLAHILSSKIGLNIVEYYGYKANWIFMACMGFIGMFFAYKLKKMIELENTETHKNQH